MKSFRGAKKQIHRDFHFLEEDYNFKVLETTQQPYISVIYKNSTTAVKVGYEPRDRGVFVLLIRLVAGEIPPYPIHLQHTERLNMFYLDDLVALRSKDSESSATRVRSPKENIARAAGALRTYATDVLNGEFDVFVELDKIVKSR